MAGISSDVRITEDFQHGSLCGVVPTVSRLLLRYQTMLLQVPIELFVRTAFKQLKDERQIGYQPVVACVNQVKCWFLKRRRDDSAFLRRRKKAITLNNAAMKGDSSTANCFTSHIGTGSNSQFLLAA